MKKSECSGNTKIAKTSCYILTFVVIGLLVNSTQPIHSLETEGHTFLITGGTQDGEFNSLEALQNHLVERTRPGSSVAINISTPVLNLTERISFSHYSRLTIASISHGTTVTCSSTNAGIVFKNMSSLELSDLKFVSCGAQINVTVTYRAKEYYSVITFIKCRDIEIMNVTVYKNNGVGMMILEHYGGHVAVLSSVFEQNSVTPRDEDNNIQGGGGVYIGNFDMKDSGRISIEFDNCTFKENVAHTRHYRHIFTNMAGQELEGHGRGGGLFLAFEQEDNPSDISVTISNCVFMGNEAFIGSGLSVKIGEVHEHNIQVFVTDTVFESNGCGNMNEGVGLGGGAHISFNSYDTSIVNSNITLRNVEFNKNCAKHGGGVFIYSHKQDSNKTSNMLIFEQCIFYKNQALTGSAVDTSPNIFKRLSSGYTIVPTFKNCSFLENRVYVNTDRYVKGVQRNAGLATVYASLCDVTFEGFTLFENNTGTAIYMVNGNADFHNSNAKFKNNSGVEGGALSLIGVSSMIVGPNNTYEFLSNYALHRGGAIFVQLIGNHDFSLSRSCFFQYRDKKKGVTTPFLASTWTSNITFSGNNASIGHSKSIFATSIFPCQVINNGSDENPYYVRVDLAIAFERWGISLDDQLDITEQIATDGGTLTLMADVETYTNAPQLTFIPGHYSEHKVQVKDDLDTNVSEPLRTTISKVSKGIKIELNNKSSFFVKDKVELQGEPGSTGLLSLQVASSRQTYITLSIELLECPPGFNLQDYKCECDAPSYAGILRCNNTRPVSYLMPGFWAGVIEDENTNKLQFATSTCPPGYCSALNETELPVSRDKLEDIICGGSNRKGVLCGNCRDNHTVYFHTVDNHCRDEHLCHLGWLFYIISELIPVTLVFVTVLVLNISFTSGAVNGFILFSQLLVSINIDASGIVQLPKTIEPVIASYTTIYGFFNLDFFHSNSTSFCLWNGATTLDVMAFKYVTIAYALLLILFVIWFMNHCAGRCLGKWCRITAMKSSVIHGISTFLIICYSQALKTSLYILNGHVVGLHKDVAQSNFTFSKRVWLNGELQYFKTRHLPYAIPALFVLIFMCILPPVLLLLFPLLNKVLDVLKIEDSKPVNFVLRWIIPINTLKPLLDSFQGCFKDNMRFFAGLYFLYRCSALISYTASSSFTVSYIVTQIFFTVFLALHALCQPYMKRAHNIIDTLLFTDIGFINLITLVHYGINRNEEARSLYSNEVIISAYLQMVLIFTPLAIFIVYVSVQGYNRVSSWYTPRKSAGRTSRNRSSKRNTYSIHLKSFTSLIRNVSSHSGNTITQDDFLPHRLIADHADCDCFEDSECTCRGSVIYREASK